MPFFPSSVQSAGCPSSPAAPVRFFHTVFACLFACLFLVCILVPGMPLQASAAQISLAVVTKPGSAQYIAAEKFAELVKERSNGATTVKIFHSGALGTETEMLQQIQLGAVQMGIITLGPFDTFVPEVKVVAFPFLFKDHATVDRVLDGPVGQEILKTLESAGFKGLAFSENGFRHLTNSRQPVHTAKDAGGLKIRVMESTFHKELWRALGANPTPMGWPIYSELQQHTIDAQENPLWVLSVYKLYEVQKYLSLTGHVYSTHIDIANLGWFNSLPADQQTLIATAMHDAAIFQRAYNRSQEAANLEEMRANGMIVEEHPDLQSFRDRVAKLRDMDMYAAPATRALLDKILEAAK